MQIHLSIWVILIWCAGVVLLQSTSDTYFTRDVLRKKTQPRLFILLATNSICMMVTILLVVFLMTWNDQFLISARDGERFFALAILGIIVEYVFIGFLFSAAKWALIRFLVMDSEDDPERISTWWGYTLVGNVVTVLFCSPPYFIITLLPPLFGQVR